MLNKAKHKTRLTQKKKKKAKHTSNATNKNKKIEESDKITQSPFSSIPWMAIETKFSKLCIFYNLDEHLYAQLSK